MRERHINRNTVISALTNPDRLEKSKEDPTKFLAKKLYSNEVLDGDHLLMVIYKIDKNHMKIITIIDTSKISKYFS